MSTIAHELVTSFDDLSTTIRSAVDIHLSPNAPIVNVVGFGGGMNNDEAFNSLKNHVDLMNVTHVALLWHGDWKKDGSITHAMACFKDLYPETVLLVAVRGPNDKGHVDFFNSWKGYDIVLIEVSEDMRSQWEVKVKEACPDQARPQDIKLGALVHDSTACDHVLCIGGGATTGGEMEYCVVTKSSLPWHVIPLSRKQGTELCHPKVIQFAAALNGTIMPACTHGTETMPPHVFPS